MREIKLTKELYLSIANEYRKFRQRTGGIYDVGLDDIFSHALNQRQKNLQYLTTGMKAQKTTRFGILKRMNIVFMYF